MSEEICEFTREPIAYTPAAYDAAIIIMLASLQADSNEAAVFASEINDVTRGGTKCSSMKNALSSSWTAPILTMKVSQAP